MFHRNICCYILTFLFNPASLIVFISSSVGALNGLAITLSQPHTDTLSTQTHHALRDEFIFLGDSEITILHLSLLLSSGGTTHDV